MALNTLSHSQNYTADFSLRSRMQSSSKRPVKKTVRRANVGLVILFALILATVLGAAFNMALSNGAGRTESRGLFEPPQAALALEVAEPVQPPQPTAIPLQNPSDPMAIVLGGKFANGGYWRWDDIANLLGVYSQYGAFIQSTIDGQAYQGVPLSFLLHYAILHQDTTAVIVYDRQGTPYTYTAGMLNACTTCLLALAPDQTIALILPGMNPPLIQPVMRIEAY